MSDTVTVYLSGDAADGDALAIISINGQQVGNIVDVSAMHSSDVADAFSFTGNYGASPQVTVSFINNITVNDGNGQRDLYVDGFAYDGAPLFGDKQEATYDQSMNFTLTTTQAPAERASTFVNSMGVDIHLGYANTSYGNIAVVASALSYLGVYHVRDGLPYAVDLPEYQALGATGIKFDLLMPDLSSDALLPGQLAVINPLVPYVSSVEGPNEVDLSYSFSWDGQSGDAAAAAYQEALWNAVKADPLLSSTPVYLLTTGNPSGYQGLGNLSAYASDGNAHSYFVDGDPPFLTLQYATGVTAVSTPGLPTVLTETGYSTAPIPLVGEDQYVQARYELDLLMDAAKQGITTTFLYELLDEFGDPGGTDYEEHFGLFTADGTPKLAATAIHNLTATLQDSGAAAASFTPGVLPYSVAGLPASGDTLLLQHSNGTYDLVVWAEPEIWNATTLTDIDVPSRTVTITLAQAVASVSVVDPLLGTSPIAQFSNTANLSVSVSDHPVILEITPVAAQAPVMTNAPSISAVATTALSTPAHYGQTITFALATTEAVAVSLAGGSPTLTLNTPGMIGSYDAADSTATTLAFMTTVTASQSTADLHVTALSLNGASITDVYGNSLSTVGVPLLPGADTGIAVSAATPLIVLGSGPNTLALNVVEDAYQGDAQFTVSIDGVQVGGAQTTTALRSAGTNQEFDVNGTFGTGQHVVLVDFLNDFYAGTASTDRNLFVTSASVDGRAIANSVLNEYSQGPQQFTFITAPQYTAITIHLAEDAWNGDAAYSLTLDGQAVGSGTVAAINRLGQSQSINLQQLLSSGVHDVGVSFLNDAFGGLPSTDRNLYITGIDVNGTPQPGASGALYCNGTLHFQVVVPAH